MNNQNTIRAAYDALKSYAYGNGSPELAKSVAEALEGEFPEFKSGYTPGVTITLPAEDWARVFSYAGKQVLFLCYYDGENADGEENVLLIRTINQGMGAQVEQKLFFEDPEDRDAAYKKLATRENAINHLKTSLF